jgi:hypothetical protein
MLPNRVMVVVANVDVVVAAGAVVIQTSETVKPLMHPLPSELGSRLIV